MQNLLINPSKTMQTQLIDLLRQYQPSDEDEKKHRDVALAFVESTERCCSRETLSGHVTASAWIVSPDSTSVLLTHHKKLGRWLQLGGHVEEDASVQDAATREAKEESGIDQIFLLAKEIYDVDVHVIPERKGIPEHRHYDFRFAFRAMTTAFCVSEESNSLAWVELASIREADVDESIQRMLRKTEGFLAALLPSHELASNHAQSPIRGPSIKKTIAQCAYWQL